MSDTAIPSAARKSLEAGGGERKRMNTINDTMDACDAPLLEIHLKISNIWYENKKLQAENEQLKKQPRCPCEEELEFIGNEQRTNNAIWRCKKCQAQMTSQFAL